MTDDNSNLVDIDEDLETFENEFYEKEENEAESEEVVEDTGDDAAETDEDTDASEEDEDNDSEEDSEEDKEPEQKKGRNRKSLQSRIDELTRRAYEAERREIEVLRRLEEREAREREVPKEKPTQATLPPGAPDPNALDDKGEPVFPLGEFDPRYIEAITRFTINTELAQKEAEAQRRQVATQIQAAQEHLKTEWAQKLEQAEEENPEIREDIGELVTTFSHIEPAYGEYLAVTIMQLDNGPQILEYLSQNIGEAQKIVASGPAAATLEIGKLNAKLGREAKRNANKVSQAAPPPEGTTRGRKGQRLVRPDTDDLNAFEKIYYD